MKKKKLPKLLKRILQIGGILSLAGVVCVLGLNIWVTASVSDRIREISSEDTESKWNEEHDCILVLGAGLRDNKPSPMLRYRLD